MAHVSGRLLPVIQYAKCTLYFNLHNCFPLSIHSPTLHPCPSAPDKSSWITERLSTLPSHREFMAEVDLIWMQRLRGLSVGPGTEARVSVNRGTQYRRKVRQSTCTVFMVFLLFLRHYAVNFLRLYLVKETEPNKTFPCPQRSHPFPLRCWLKLTPLISHSSLWLQAHSTAVTLVFAPCATLGTLPSDLKGPSIPLPLQNRHPRSLSSVSVTTRMLPTSHQVLHLCCPWNDIQSHKFGSDWSLEGQYFTNIPNTIFSVPFIIGLEACWGLFILFNLFPTLPSGTKQKS